MPITRIASFRSTKSTSAILIECDGQKLEIKQSDLTMLNTSTKVSDSLTAAATAVKIKLPPIFIHKNRDGSYAIAAGKEPRIWPEDDKP